MADKIAVWPAGIDERYWSPNGPSERNSILINVKRADPKLVEETCEFVERYYPIVVATYGSYSQSQYRKYLGNSRAYVVVSGTETQGLAHAEAWSMDVPTFVHRSTEDTTSGASPYLCPSTGTFWSSTDQLLDSLNTLSNETFAPRRWVLENMTDAISAQRLLELMSRKVSV